MDQTGDNLRSISDDADGILIVDDDSDSLQLLSDLLRGEGYQVRAAKNGQIAIDSIKIKAPDLILMDVRMPGMSGYEVCHQIKSDPVTRDIPIIFISAYDDTTGKVEGFDLGGVDFISKPIDGPEVLARIRTHLTLHHLTHSLERLVAQRTADLADANRELEQQIAEKKKAEEESSSLSRQLRQTQKLEAIGTLAGGIAHDFNNILSSIIGFTELAMEDAPKDTMLEDNLNEVMLAGKRAKELVNQILAFARKTDEVYSPVQIGLIAKEVLKLLRATIPTSLAIRHNIQSTGKVMSDPAQIHQIFMNLCTNAAHAMEDCGGELKIEVDDVALTTKNRIQAPSLPAGNYVRIRISDTGCGIMEEELDQIFEPYFTTKTPNEGTGLGLSVVHGIVTSCGGEISVSSRLAHGSTFTVLLPTVNVGDIFNEQLKEVNPRGTESVLIVDDEMPIAKMHGSALEQQGYTITMCTNSQAALALFHTNPRRFDLVLTDMTMPNMSGDIMAKEMRLVRPDIPIILFTGYHKQMTEAQAIQMGFDAFEMKPLTKTMLLNTVRNVLDKNGRNLKSI